MRPDFYKVQVIHYLNPHLIWVEVCDPTTVEKYKFEQIGIYGILPLDKTLDFTTEELKVQKCDAWIPAATKLLKDILNESVEVWFSPVQILKRSSIFDDNIHKFGELCIKHKDDKFKKVSKLLIKTSLAYLDIEEFEKKLSSGQLKTRLSSVKTQQVINAIEKYYTQNALKKKAIKKQTSIFQMSQEFESSLTISNVEKHNNEMINSMLKNKAKDFELCKDIDDESVGCGFKVKPETRERKTSENDFKKSYNEIKQILDAHVKDASVSDSSKTDQNKKDVLNKPRHRLSLLKMIQKNDKKLKETKVEKIESKNYDSSTFDDNDGEVLCIKTESKTINKATEPSPTKESLLEWNDIDNVPSIEKAGKSNAKKKYVKQVAYGPPGLNIQKFKIQEWQLTEDDANDVDNVDNKIGEIAFDRNKMFEDSRSQLEEAEQNTLDAYFTKINNATNIKDVASNVMEIAFDRNKVLKSDGAHLEEIKKGQDELDEYFTKLNDAANIKEKTTYNKSNNRMKEIALDINKELEDDDDFLSKISNASDLKEKNAEISKIEEDSKDETDSTQTTTKSSTSGSILKRKLEVLHNLSKNLSSNSNTSTKDESSVSERNASSDEDMDDIVKRLTAKYKSSSVIEKKQTKTIPNEVQKNNVNPFKNIDANISVFVDKLLTPVLMVHSKMNKRIQPKQQMRDIYFNTHIHNVLKRMSIEYPKMLQTVSWSIILRGHSLFMISPMNSGKTVGYLPAVCRLVSDSSPIQDSNGPIAIIVCATAKSATIVENMAEKFLGLQRILTCYPGVDDFHIATALLNGCDLLISTPSFLCRLLHLSDFGVDLRRLSIFVLDDCERLFDIYLDEVKFFQAKIKEMLKKRTNKEAKVQYVLASRVWFDYMESLAIKAPDTVVCIGAFQECVLYSKTNVSVTFVKSDVKVNCVLNFLEEIDKSKKTVIVCKSDDEVDLLEKTLRKLKHVIFACHNQMTVQDLYNLSNSWSEFEEPVLGPILLCCDGNLTHMNVTDAHNLIHYSLPNLYSMFCKRFSVLNDFYPSIFKNEGEKIKIKILVEESNAEQLPRIINFIKRCADVPDMLDEVCKTNLIEKDITRAKNLVPLCDSFLMLGCCPEVFNCNERHTILKDFDTPQDWMPKEGFVTFKILHYHSATLYSGILLTNIVDGRVTKYPQKFHNLSLKMGLYYCKESNRKLLGVPKVGDICAVSIKCNLYVRCQVVKILSWYERGNPNHVLIKLIDEEWFEVSRDIYLYYLPKELESIQIPVAQIRLANIAPKDNDIAFSDLAMSHVKKLIDGDEEVFLRGHIALTLGNCIFVDTLKVCQSLKSLDETVEKHNIKLELLKDHAILNEDHLHQLEKLCVDSGLHLKSKTIVLGNELNECSTLVRQEKQINNTNAQFHHDTSTDNEENIMINKSEVIIQTTEHLDTSSDSNSENYELSKNMLELEIKKEKEKANLGKIDTPETENVSLMKVLNDNNEDINHENVHKLTQIVNIQNNNSLSENIVARESETIVLNRSKGTWISLQENEMNCVYLGFSKNPEKFFVRLQESEKHIVRLLDDIDVYLANIQTKQVNFKVGELVLAKFPDDSTYERARIDKINGEKVSCFFLDQGDYLELPQDHLLPITDEIINKLPFQAIECKLLGIQPLNGEWTESNNKWFCDYCCPGEKQLFVKYYEKEAAEFTGDFKYGVVLFDTNSEKDVNVNQLVIDLNLAKEKLDEVQYLHEFNSNMIKNEDSTEDSQDLIEVDSKPSSHLFLPPPIRTVPLVGSDESDDDDRWDVNFNSDTIQEILPQATTLKNNLSSKNTNKIQHISKSAICDTDVNGAKLNSTTELDSDDLTSPDTTQVNISKKLNTGEVRRPKLLWRQNKTTVTISILVDVDNYDIVINERSLKFRAVLNNAKYEFDYELYGMIDKEKSTHSKQGLCVSVKLVKILTKNWLTLTRDSIKQGVSYDVSTIETSSDEEDRVDDSNLKKMISGRAPDDQSESDDDHFIDDANY